MAFRATRSDHLSRSNSYLRASSGGMTSVFNAMQRDDLLMARVTYAAIADCQATSNCGADHEAVLVLACA